MPDADDTELHTEAMKLLLQVAWANDRLHPKEEELLAKLAAAWKVPHVLADLLAARRAGKPLSQPNLGLVRTRADKILLAAQVLVAADGEVDEEEDSLMRELKALLGKS